MCEANLPSKAELQDHFRLHANGEIDMKGRSKKTVQASSNKLQEQEKEPTMSKLTKCDVCPETFETPTLAIQHKFRKHRGSQKKYFCGFCGKQFPLEVCKENHIASDHKTEKKGSKIYQCKDCTAQFFNMEAIKYHIRSAHQRVSSLINPTFTCGPSKKIKLNIAGEPNSVFYCHLCGHEYMVKFNLQKHIESQHSQEERNSAPQQMIKCKLCEAVFYNKKAWDSHNMLHSPEDLYINSEADRRLAVTRVDQDFDHSRVPTMLDKLLPVSRQRQQGVSVGKGGAGPKSQGRGQDQESVARSEAKAEGRPEVKEGRNRALRDSDSDDDKSDTSIEDDEEEEDQRPPKRKKKWEKV